MPPRPPVTISHVHQLPLAVHELRHGRDLVRNGRGDCDPHAQGLEPLGEPGGVRVDDVAGDDLVPDREERRTHEPSMRDPPDPAHRHGTPGSITDRALSLRGAIPATQRGRCRRSSRHAARTRIGHLLGTARLERPAASVPRRSATHRDRAPTAPLTRIGAPTGVFDFSATTPGEATASSSTSLRARAARCSRPRRASLCCRQR